MMKKMSYLSSSAFAVGAFATALFAVGCGGGGDDVPPTPSDLEIIARDGDTFPGGFEVLTIESANMSDDGTVAIIASEVATPSFNGVFMKRSGESVRSVLTEGHSLAEGLSFVNVRNLSMAPTGEFAFEIGNQLDNDGVFFWDGSQVSAVARTAVESTGTQAHPEGFRLAGALRVARGGLVVFTDAISPCTVDETDPEDIDIRCDLRIHTAQNGQVSQVEVPNGLTNQTPNAVLIEVNSRGEAALGMSARGSEPLIGLIRGGQFEGLLPRRADVEGLGVVTSARPRAISPTGAIALDGFFDEDGDGARDQERVLLFENGALTSIETRGGMFEGNPEVDVRAEGIDGDNRVVYRVDFESSAAGETLRSIRAWKDGRRSFIAHEGMGFGEDRNGDPQRILDIEQVRVAENGDVVLVVQLGDTDADMGTRTISGTALLRWNGGGLQTVLELGANVGGGELVDDISIADINAAGDLLLISSINRNANRVLLFLPRL